MKYVSFKRLNDELLKSKTSIKVTSISMAVGVGLAFSPFPGLHLITAFVCIKVFQLNGVVVLAGTLIHNPWTMIPIHMAGLMVGDILIFGDLHSVAQFRLFPWDELGLFSVFSREFWQEHGGVLLGFIKPFFLGSMLLSLGASLLASVLTYYFLNRKNKKVVS